MLQRRHAWRELRFGGKGEATHRPHVGPNVARCGADAAVVVQDARVKRAGSSDTPTEGASWSLLPARLNDNGTAHPTSSDGTQDGGEKGSTRRTI